MDGRLKNRGKAEFYRAYKSPADLANFFESHQGIQGLAMLGRSNVGKSSLINRLFGKGVARASNTPGRTREIIVFTFFLEGSDDPYYLFDLPGYGFAKVSKAMAKNWDELMGQFFASVPREILMVNLQDARHPNQKNDQKFQGFLVQYENPIQLIFNKIDKLKKQKERSQLGKEIKAILPHYTHVDQIHRVSAETGEGINELEISLESYLLGLRL